MNLSRSAMRRWLAIPVLEIGPHRRAPVEVGHRFAVRAGTPARARERPLDLDLEPPHQLFDHFARYAADRLAHARIGLALEGDQCLEQVGIRLDRGERLRVLQDLAHAEAFDCMRLNRFVHRGWKQRTHLAQPTDDCELRGLEARATLALGSVAAPANAARRIGAAVDFVEDAVHTLIGGSKRLRHVALGEAAEREPPAAQPD